MVTRKKAPRRARRYYRAIRRRTKNKKIALLPLFGGVVYPVMDSLSKSNFIHDVQQPGGMMNATKGLVDQLGQHYTGFSIFPELGAQTSFQPMEAVKTYGALGAGVVGHMLANKFGVNRQIKRVPFIGNKIEL